MKVLVIGGTQFIGRHVVENLLAANHDVTLLNRGQTGAKLFPDLNLIKADRQSHELKNIKPLRQNWDAVIDLCAYYPKDVSRILEILKGQTERYIFCSTISVYIASAMNEPTPIIDETSPLLDCTEKEASDTSMTTYGQRKAECERIIMNQHATGVPATILRPSVVYGAHDYTDRFAYWIWRASEDKPFFLPDDGAEITNRTYAPDLASAFVACLKSNVILGEAYNIAEKNPLSFRDTIDCIGTHLHKKPLEYAVSVPSEWLLKEKVKPWSNLPFWLPRMNLIIDAAKSRKDLAFADTSPAKALAEASDSFLAENRAPKAGLSQRAEADLLAKFKT